MTETNPHLAIVLLNFNGKNDTIECLKSLLPVALTQKCQIIVVDNHSSDGSVLAFEDFATRNKQLALKIIAGETNLGFAQGNNVGIKMALDDMADFVFLLNNDTIADRNLLVELLHSSQKNQEAGIFGAKVYFAPGYEYHKQRYGEKEKGKVLWYAGGIIDWNNVILSHRGVDEIDNGQFESGGETDFVSGCAMLVSRKVLEKIGLFDQDYFLYFEDADLCERAKRAGYKIWYEPKAYLWHKNASASGRPGSALHIYYQTRNRLLFGFRYAPWRTKFALLRESIKMLTVDKVRQQAILDFYLRNFGKGSIK